MGNKLSGHQNSEMDPAIDLEQLFGASESQDMVNGRFFAEHPERKKKRAFSRA
jgi:hypothetical protein